MNELMAMYGAELIEWVRNIEEFSNEQLPPLIDEILTYGLMRQLIVLKASIIVLAAMILAIIGLCIKVHYDEWSDAMFGVGVISVVMVFPIGLIITSSLTIKMIETAPRLYIIKQLSTLF